MSNQDIIYLDNAATTFPKPEIVYQAMDSFYRQYGGNAGRGSNPLARKAASLVDETRQLVQQWLQVPEVVFTPSATIALNVAIMGSGLRSGDVVYVSPFEHNSVLRPLEYLRQRIGIQIEKLPFDRNTLECKLDEVEALFKLEPPAMVCATLVSNVLGLVLPIDDLIGIAKAASENVITIVDGAQAAGLLEINTSQIDVLVFSGHKSFYGPYGIAGIGFGTNWRPNPIFMGGTGTQSESIEMPQSGASRYEAGSQNIHAVAGLNAALKWLADTGRDTIVSHTRMMMSAILEMLSDIPSVALYIPSNTQQQFGATSFAIDGVMPQAVENALGANNIAVRAGLHCSPWAHEFINSMGKGGTVRVSVGQFNNENDVTLLADVIRQVVYM